MKKKAMILAMMLLSTLLNAQDIKVTIRPEQPYDWLGNVPSSVTRMPTYTPDWGFIERMQGRANAQVQSMVAEGYYYDDIDQQWVAPDEFKRRQTELQTLIGKMGNNKIIISDDGWYNANWYVESSPIAVVYGGEVYIKKGELKKLRINTNLSVKFARDHNVGKSNKSKVGSYGCKSRVSGRVSNRSAGSIYGKYIDIYLLNKILVNKVHMDDIYQ